LLPVITILSFCTAFLRDVLLAGSLGAGQLSDYLWLALLLPAVFENVGGMPLRDAVIARLSGRGRSSIGAWIVVVPMLAAAGVLVLPLWLASGSVVPLLAPGWSGDVVTVAVPVFVLGLLLLPVHAAYYAQTALASMRNRFAWAHARSVVLNIGAITACLVWPGEVMVVLGSILAAAIGHGVILQFNAGAPVVSTASLPAQRAASTHGLTLLAGFAVLAVMQQTCVLLERVLASGLSAGAITCLSVAYRFATIPLAVGVGSLIVPYYVRLEASRESAPAEFMQVLWPMAQSSFWVVLPAAAVMWGCGQEITAMLFVRGAFSAADGAQVAAALSMYAWGLPFFCAVLLLGRALFARRLIKVTVASSLIATMCYAAAGYGLRTNLDVPGLAALMSGSALIQATCFFAVLASHLGWRQLVPAGKGEEVVVLLTLVLLLALLLRWWPQRSWPALAAVGLAWGCVYGALTWRTVPFLSRFAGRVGRRFN